MPTAPSLRWRVLWAGLIVVVAVGAAAAATLLPGLPRWWAVPLTVLLPLMVSESLILGLIPLTAIVVWLSIPVVSGRLRSPWWTGVPILAIAVLSLLYFIQGPSHGLEYQGMTYIWICGPIHSGTPALLASLWVVSRSERSYPLVVAWHAIAAVWMASYAFPYYGKLL